jgi:GWxTD domain-containing protein
MKIKITNIFIVFFLLSSRIIIADNLENNSPKFYFDAIVFKADNKDEARVDILLAIPHQTVTFLKNELNLYAAHYQVSINCYDKYGNLAQSKSSDRFITSSTYEESKGANAEFDASFYQLFLTSGEYKISIIIEDMISHLKLEKSREITVVDFLKFPFSLSGLLLVSSIFDSDNSASITPYLSDNISNLNDGFFVFFETYNQREPDSVDFIYQILDSDKIIEQSSRITKLIQKGTNQNYIKINKLSNLKIGSYFLKVIALQKSNDAVAAESEYLAVSQRTISYIPTLSGTIIENLDLAIEQMRFVATNAQLSLIEDAPSYELKLNRFREFWDELDPTPNTERNEAFEEYYDRIEYANSKFRSYAQGWQTDMGIVYIVFGKPASVEKRQDYNNSNRQYERWSYSNGKEFVFVDNNGFGDFKLLSPAMISEKYQYGNNR